MAAKKRGSKRNSKSKRRAKTEKPRKRIAKKRSPRRAAAKKKQVKKTQTKKKQAKKKQAKKVLKRSKSGAQPRLFTASATATTFRADCQSGDFEGPTRSTKASAQTDALAHQANRPGHIVDVVEEQSES